AASPTSAIEARSPLSMAAKACSALSVHSFSQFPVLAAIAEAVISSVATKQRTISRHLSLDLSIDVSPYKFAYKLLYLSPSRMRSVHGGRPPAEPLFTKVRL